MKINIELKTLVGQVKDADHEIAPFLVDWDYVTETYNGVYLVIQEKRQGHWDCCIEITCPQTEVDRSRGRPWEYTKWSDDEIRWQIAAEVNGQELIRHLEANLDSLESALYEHIANRDLDERDRECWEYDKVTDSLIDIPYDDPVDCEFFDGRSFYDVDWSKVTHDDITRWVNEAKARSPRIIGNPYEILIDVWESFL